MTNFKGFCHVNCLRPAKSLSLWNSYLNPIDNINKKISFFSLGCEKAANAQFKEADSRLTEAYHVLLNAKVCSDREFVRP